MPLMLQALWPGLGLWVQAGIRSERPCRRLFDRRAGEGKKISGPGGGGETRLLAKFVAKLTIFITF